MSQTPIRVLIADDHLVVRSAVRRLLADEPDVEVVGEAPDGLAAVEQTRRLHPDVVLLDVSLPRLNGIEAARRIVAESPEVRVVGFSMHDTQEVAGRMLDAGAAAYVPKGGPVEILLAAIRDERACAT